MKYNSLNTHSDHTETNQWRYLPKCAGGSPEHSPGNENEILYIPCIQVTFNFAKGLLIVLHTMLLSALYMHIHSRVTLDKVHTSKQGEKYAHTILLHTLMYQFRLALIKGVHPPSKQTKGGGGGDGEGERGQAN